MRNVQQRIIDAPIDAVGAIFDTVSSPDDRIWPSENWPPLFLDAGLKVGSSGGHGPIRYSVGEYEPGRRVRFVTAPDLELVGYHEFALTPGAKGTTLVTHTIAAEVEGRMRLAWPLVIRWIHEAMLGDILDNFEREATGTLKAGPTKWTLWVRLLRRVFGPRKAKVSR